MPSVFLGFCSFLLCHPEDPVHPPSPGSVQCVCYCLNTANNLLGNEFKEALHRKTREPNLAAKLFSGAGAAPKSGAEIATALNNVDVSAEYVQKLRHELDEFCGEVGLRPAACSNWSLEKGIRRLQCHLRLL
jgi:hypothetical protein